MIETARRMKNIFENPHVTAPADVIFAVLSGTTIEKTSEIASRIAKLRSVSCRCSIEFVRDANKKLNGTRSRPIKRILPQKKSRFENVDHRPKSGVKNLTVSHRQPIKNAVKKIISVDCVISKDFKILKTMTGTERTIIIIEIIVAVKL